MIINNNETKQVVFMTREDYEQMLSDHVQAQIKAQTAEVPADISIKGEIIKPLTVNGVQYVSRQDTAKLLGKSFPTLFRWNRDGILKAVKLGGQSVYYRYTDIVKLLEGNVEPIKIS